MEGRIWTISNFLSFTRVLLVIPIAALLLADTAEARTFAIGLIVVATFTDLFDGMLARKLDQVTELGKLIDPLADKIAVGVVAVILLMQGKLPAWFVLVAIIRDVMIFFGGMYINKTKGVLLQSNTAGKWAVTVITALVLITILDLNGVIWLKYLFLALSTVLLLLSFGLYLKRFLEIAAPQRSPIQYPKSKM